MKAFAVYVVVFMTVGCAVLAEAKTKKPGQTTKTTHQDAGERAFQENCSRCHYAPESLSPRITGTVVRHMRVRANISAEDERLILKYLNP